MKGLVLKESVVLRHEEVNLRRPFSKKYRDNTLCCPSKILHKHCFQFLLELTIAPREIENNFWETTKSIYGIHHFHIDHDAPCLPP